MIELYQYETANIWLCDDHYIYAEANLQPAQIIEYIKSCKHCTYTYKEDN